MATTTMKSMMLTFVLYSVDTECGMRTTFTLPFFSSFVSAGFPSPADEHTDHSIDLNTLLIRHPAATFLVRAQGESMRDAGILNGDVLVVDKSITPLSGQTVVAYRDGEFLVKRLTGTAPRLFLEAVNAQFVFKPIAVGEDVIIWGVVVGVVRDTLCHSLS